jgi:hypothetical protein
MLHTSSSARTFQALSIETDCEALGSVSSDSQTLEDAQAAKAVCWAEDRHEFLEEFAGDADLGEDEEDALEDCLGSAPCSIAPQLPGRHGPDRHSAPVCTGLKQASEVAAKAEGCFATHR